MIPSPDKRLLKAKKSVVAALKQLGVTADENVIDNGGDGFAWQVARGSATVMISLNPPVEKMAPRMRIVSPVVEIDEEARAPLAVRLLELNGVELPGVAFGLIGQKVVLLAERSVVGLDQSEVLELISMVGVYADRYDDLLVAEFGGRRVSDLK